MLWLYFYQIILGCMLLVWTQGSYLPYHLSHSTSCETFFEKAFKKVSCLEDHPSIFCPLCMKIDKCVDVSPGPRWVTEMTFFCLSFVLCMYSALFSTYSPHLCTSFCHDFLSLRVYLWPWCEVSWWNLVCMTCYSLSLGYRDSLMKRFMILPSITCIPWVMLC
jgi:hypothetical protein